MNNIPIKDCKTITHRPNVDIYDILVIKIKIKIHFRQAKDFEPRDNEASRNQVYQRNSIS